MYPCDCEDKAIQKLEKQAAKMAKEFWPLWNLGDGRGGYVMELIRKEFQREWDNV